MNYLGDNIKALRKSKELTQADLAGKLGLTRSLIGAYEEGRSEPKLKTLQAICLLFKTDLTQLINKPIDPKQSKGQPLADIPGNTLRVLPVSVNAEGNEQVSLIPQKAAAGYTKGYGDMEYIEQLQVAELPFPELAKERTYRIFQIEGESMLPVQPGSYIISEYVADWNTIKDNECYVLITLNDGIVYKRLVNKIQIQQRVLLKSDNKEYSPYHLHVSEINEVWRARGILSFDIPNTNTYNDLANIGILNAMGELRDEITDLKNRLS